MSHIAYSGHIAITSGDKSTTRSKRFSMSLPVAPLIRVTLRDSSDTQRRNGQIRKSHPPSPQLPSSTASRSRHLARNRWYMAAASSYSLLDRALMAADTSATDWSARSASSSSSCTNPP
jgi:hypothetical protein